MPGKNRKKSESAADPGSASSTPSRGRQNRQLGRLLEFLDAFEKQHAEEMKQSNITREKILNRQTRSRWRENPTGMLSTIKKVFERLREIAQDIDVADLMLPWETEVVLREELGMPAGRRVEDLRYGAWPTKHDGSGFVGREKELTQLFEAWLNPAQRVISVISEGGQGKTHLVTEWLRKMESLNYGGARQVFTYSFFKQGFSSDKPASVDEFVNRAFAGLEFVENPDSDHWTRLATYLKHNRVLLVIDGLETLQYTPRTDERRLKNSDMQGLLTFLAINNSGLCVITSRVPVRELESTQQRVIELQPFEPEESVRFLERFELMDHKKLRGPSKELEAAAQWLRGHPLSLRLLGSYLIKVWDGDIRRWNELRRFHEVLENSGESVRIILAKYEEWLGEGPELQILRLVSLFDRPAGPKSIEAVVRADPPIPHLTDQLPRPSDGT